MYQILRGLKSGYKYGNSEHQDWADFLSDLHF